MPKAAILTALDQPLEVHEVELDSPKAGEVRIRMGAISLILRKIVLQSSE